MKRVRGHLLIEIIVVMAIIAVLAGAVYGTKSVFSKGGAQARKDGKGGSALSLSKLKADDTVCISNIKQVRLALQVASTNADDAFPATLEETKLPKEFYSCPLGHEAYNYDPKTGIVTCVHPGHEKY